MDDRSGAGKMIKMILLRSVLRQPLATLASGAVVLLAISACAPVTTADILEWQSRVLPADAAVAAESGRIVDDRPVVRSADLAAGAYQLTMVCEGGGKAFVAVRPAGSELLELGAACNGARESLKLTVSEPGPVELSTSSVDAPVMYAYRLIALE